MNIKTKAVIFAFAAAWTLWTVSCEQTGGLAAQSGNPSGEEEDEYTLEDTSGETYVPYITGVAITQYPDKTYFANGQTFSHEGLELRFVYDNGEYGRKLDPAAEYTVEEIDTAAHAPVSGTKPIQVTVTVLSTPEYDSSSSVKYGIIIDSSTSVLGSLAMTTPPSKLAYYLGEDFSAAGLKASATYEGGDKDGQQVTVDAGAATASGYNKYRRGSQTVTLKLNGATLGSVDVAVRIPPNANIELNRFSDVRGNLRDTILAPVRIRTMPFDPARSNLRVTVRTGGNFTMDYGNGGITEADTVTGYDSGTIGLQRLTLRLNPEDYELPFEIYVADAEAEVWFDYGYRRHKDDPRGTGLVGAGVYYVEQSKTIILAPVRFLLGYDADGKDTGVSYNWTVTQGAATCGMDTPGNKEFCYFTPNSTGTYKVKVEVTGRDFVTGATVAKTAETDVVCYTPPANAAALKSVKYKHFAPGQHNEGDGYGWSLGAVLGYEFWTLPNGAATLEVYGNPFWPWSEAGIVWVQEDNNGNGKPDETWYEIRGSEDDDPLYSKKITRRYALSYYRGPNPPGAEDTGVGGLVYNPSLDTEKINAQQGPGSRMQRTVYWVDCKGRSGRLHGWPCGDYLSDDLNTRLTFTGTLLRDDGEIAVDRYTDLVHLAYVDTAQASDKYPYGHFNVARDAIKADGSAANLNPARVRFVKVQTAFFRYGGNFGNVSTEIVRGTNLSDQSGGFPMPDGIVGSVR
jgi:hypothetical protein